MRQVVSQKWIALLAVAIPFMSIAGCKDDDKSGTYYGTSVNVGSGTGKAWVELNKDGDPTAIGVTLSESAMNGLSATDSQDFTFNFPDESEATLFKHVTLNWNPHGHPPVNIYTTAHFDVHFYMISSSERMLISATDTTKFNRAIADKYVATNYQKDAISLPQMGIHWIDPTSPEFTPGTAFTSSFIYGSYDGKWVFYEPMIDKAFLETKQHTIKDIKQPSAYMQSGYYPTKYEIHYDSSAHEYVIMLDNLTMREAS